VKQRIPPDVERLMWLVAESHDPSAVADFESRFPELKQELARRRRMVSELKGAKGASASIPVFQPRSTGSQAPRTKQILIGGAFALAALAAASYSVTKWMLTPVPKPPVVTPVRTDSPMNVVPPVVYKQPQKQDNPAPVNQQPVQHPETTPTQSNVEQPKTVKMSNTSLVAALKMIGAESGYSVEVAPGFHDQKVTLDYENETASAIFKDLGMRYQFTAFDQGDGTIIIVPAVDHGGPTGDTNGSDRQLGG